MRIHRDPNMSIHKTTHMRIHNDANMSFHKDRPSPPTIEATRAGSLRSGRALHNQPVTSVPVPGFGPARRAHERRPQRTMPLRGPLRLPDFSQHRHNRAARGTQNRWPGNHNECAPLPAVIIKANTNADNPTTRAVMFHLGKHIPQGVPDTYGFNGIDASQCTGDTIALTYPSGIGLGTTVKFRWNGNGVEIIGNPPGA